MSTADLIDLLKRMDPTGDGRVYFWNDATATNEVSGAVKAEGSGYRKGYHHGPNDVVLLPPVDW